MSDAVIVGAGFVFLVLLGLGLSIYWMVLKGLMREQLEAISGRYPDALVVSAQSGVETYRALWRLGQAQGLSYGRTGKVYAISACPGHLRLHRGRSARVFVDLTAAELADFRVGTTSVAFANYTTLVFGVRGANTTFELPVRVMGPRTTSMTTATKDWAEARGAEIMRTVDASP